MEEKISVAEAFQARAAEAEAVKAARSDRQ